MASEQARWLREVTPLVDVSAMLPNPNPSSHVRIEDVLGGVETETTKDDDVGVARVWPAIICLRIGSAWLANESAQYDSTV